MAWIESHQTLDKNGKVLELALMLQVNRYQMIGHLHALWWWAIDNAEDGNLKRFSNDTVTQACGWTDYIKDEIDLSRINEVTNKDKWNDLVPSLIKCGFLDEIDGGLWIHNWAEYTARYFKSVKKFKRVRKLTNERVKRFRNRNASVTQVKRSVTGLTLPNLTKPNLTKPNLTLLNLTKAGFDKFWERYPKKVGKQEAFKSWEALKPDETIQTKILDAVKWQSRQDQWIKSKGEFIPHASTWLNKRRYDDEQPKLKGNSSPDTEGSKWQGIGKKIQV